MVEFTDGDFSKEEKFFVESDPARIYRGVKDLLVNEFDMERIEEGHNKFDVSAPKDSAEIHAYKRKSPHTLIHYEIELSAGTSGGGFERKDSDQAVMKATISCSAEVISYYPGRESLEWLSKPITHDNPAGGGLNPESQSRWERSKLYKVLASIWHDKIYSKEVGRYSEEAEEDCLRIHNIMREKFGIEKSIQSGDSQYKPKWG